MKPSHGQQQNNQPLKHEWLLPGGKEHFRGGNSMGKDSVGKAYAHVGIESNHTYRGVFYTRTRGHEEVRSDEKTVMAFTFCLRAAIFSSRNHLFSL